MREIVFDTETTGLNFGSGDRMVEIGCIELINRCQTGRTFHAYFNPERPMDPVAQRVHGLSDVFLADKPKFPAVADSLLDFLGDCPLVAHNASFDLGFLNGELQRCGKLLCAIERMVDTQEIAKRRHPGAKLNLDALCVRYGIDRSHRILHGALLDAQLLAQLYVELTGGRQIGLSLIDTAAPQADLRAPVARSIVRPARVFHPTAAESARHAAFVAQLADPLWLSGQPG